MSEVNNKQRLLRLMRYLYECTDENHQISTQELVRMFTAESASAGRKTVKNDIDILMQEGYDVVVNKSSHNSFFLASRELEVEEVKLLIDAVSASRFITKERSDALIGKLSKLVSRWQAERMTRRLYTAEAVRPASEQIYLIVDQVTEAMNDGKTISFQYLDYTPEKVRVLRHDGEIYRCSPYALVWDDNHYYMAAWSEKHGAIGNFRLDRMVHPQILNEPAVPAPEGFHIDTYVQQQFRMFVGEETEVVLEADNSLMRTIIDYFGIDVPTWRKTEDSFCVRAKVAASPTFYGWIFQFGGRVKILQPESVKKEYLAIARRVLKESK